MSGTKNTILITDGHISRVNKVSEYSEVFVNITHNGTQYNNVRLNRHIFNDIMNGVPVYGEFVGNSFKKDK